MEYDESVEVVGEIVYLQTLYRNASNNCRINKNGICIIQTLILQLRKNTFAWNH